MTIESTPIEGCFIIHPTIFTDSRGFFFESFNKKKFQELTGISCEFVQDNLAKSEYGVIRGLHQQLAPYAQAKLVLVINGTILDVVVDARKNSPTFGKHFAIELSEVNRKQLYIPKGCLHGYSVLSETSLVFYKCDEFYFKDAEKGVYPLDPELGIDWKIPVEKQILSDKDKNAQLFRSLY